MIAVTARAAGMGFALLRMKPGLTVPRIAPPPAAMVFAPLRSNAARLINANWIAAPAAAEAAEEESPRMAT